MVGQALWELLRYDLLVSLGGFRLVRRSLSTPARLGTMKSCRQAAEICDAVDRAICLYWKPVMCLQKSVVTARMLRKQRWDAKVVVGCRPEPFYSHAWVEIDGLVVNDSPLYKVRLPALLQL
jgi:hypothetical protein